LSAPKLELALARQAERDIRDILQYTLETWGEEQMERYAADLEAGIERLRENPGLGRRREDLYAGCRYYRVKEHSIFYSANEQILSIARVLHVRMDARRHF
jgi:toxin ParE1/3/4